MEKKNVVVATRNANRNSKTAEIVAVPEIDIEKELDDIYARPTHGGENVYESSEELSLSSLHTALTRRLSGRKSTFNSVSFDAITGCVALISSLILIISFFHEVLAINYSHKFIMNYIHAKDGQK